MASNTLTFSSPNPARFISGLGTPAVMLMMLSMVVLPLPAMALDILFTVSIALAIMVLMASIYANRPLDNDLFSTS